MLKSFSNASYFYLFIIYFFIIYLFIICYIYYHGWFLITKYVKKSLQKQFQFEILTFLTCLKNLTGTEPLTSEFYSPLPEFSLTSGIELNKPYCRIELLFQEHMDVL